MSVQLRLYDLSNGLAHQISTSLLGKYIEGIWHSGIVYNDIEFFYGGGICKQPAGDYASGVPTKVVSLGTTMVSLQVFQEFLENISYKYTLEAYHLLHHNCNHFTDECAKFLLGIHIPDYVKNLSADVINTPFGAMIQPLINSFIQRKNENIKPVVDSFEQYIKHDDVFPRFSQVTDEVEMQEFNKNDGVLIFWDPSDDQFLLHWADRLNMLEGNVACVDCLRFPYLGKGQCPLIQAFMQGEIVISDQTPEAISHVIAIFAS